MRIIACALIGFTFLAACENKGLRQITSRGDGPDEFIVVPAKPLKQPANYASLPPPTPGGSNRTDQRPLSESIVKLGGQRGSVNAPIPSREVALVNRASRFGVDPAIRTNLAKADAEFRKRKARFTQIRLFPEDLYNKAYRREALDGARTAKAYRRAGIPTPSAPPS